MVAKQAAENHGDKWGLTWYLQWAQWTHLQNSLAATEALSIKYPPVEHLSNDDKDHTNQQKNSHKLCNEIRNPVLRLLKS